MSQSSSLDMSQWFEYAKVFGVVALLIFAFVEYRAFVNSPVGQALGKALGAAFAALAWLADHPILAIFGIVLLLLLGPLVSGLGSKGRDDVVEKVKELLDKDRKGVLDRALDGLDPESRDLAKEAGTARNAEAWCSNALQYETLSPEAREAYTRTAAAAKAAYDNAHGDFIQRERERGASEKEANEKFERAMRRFPIE